MRRLFRRLAAHLVHNGLPCLKDDILTHASMRELAKRLYRAERYKSLQTRLRARFYENDIMLEQLPVHQCYLVEVVLTGERDTVTPRNISVAVYHVGDTPNWPAYKPNNKTWQDGRIFFILHEDRLNKVGLEFAEQVIQPGKRPVMVYRPGWHLTTPMARQRYAYG